MLARLGPKTQSWDGLPSGKGEMTWADWSAVCAGLDDSATRYGWLRYVHAVSRDDMLACSVLPNDRMGRVGLRREITALNVRAVQVSLHAGYKRAWFGKAGRDLTIRLGELALAESIDPSRCACCRGTGEKIVARLAKPCSRCDGTGAGKISGREKALLLGLSETTYRRHWRHVYEDLYAHFERWNGSVMEMIRREYAGAREPV